MNSLERFVLSIFSITLLACSHVDEVSEVRLSKYSVKLAPGDTESIYASVIPADAPYESILWSSDNRSVVAVSDGTITAMRVGNALVTATVNGVSSLPCSVTVEGILISQIRLNESSLTMQEGESFLLTASISPENATDRTVFWTSLDPTIATVSSDGMVQAITAGKATVLCQSTDGNAFASCLITVRPRIISVSSIGLDQNSLTLTEGDSKTLIATVLPEDATDKTVFWSSDNPLTANVSSSGEVTAVAAGTAIITATTNDGDKKAQCVVTVLAKVVPVTGISLNYTSLSLTEGDIKSLSATISPSNATDKSVTWSSSDISVATVSSNGTVIAMAEGKATITATSNDGGKTATCSVTVKAMVIPVESVSLEPKSTTLTVGDTISLKAAITPFNATNQSVTWSSNNTAVATVSSSGVITAKAAGSATITVKTVDGSKTATCAVTVKSATVAVTGVALNKTSLSMTEGETQTLTATVTPSNATNKKVTWSSNNTTVATVSSSGVITAKAAGSATITVKTDDGDKTATCAVTVKSATVAVTGVALNKTSLSMTEGERQTLTATVTPSNATNKNVTWSSDNTTVASVSSSGVITAKATGSANITVKTDDGDKTATCAVTVKSATVSVTGVTLNKTSLSMTEGETQTLTATVIPSNATNKNVTWSSDNSTVATVSSSGVITAKAAGSATITVKTDDGNKIATCYVTVSSSSYTSVLGPIDFGKVPFVCEPITIGINWHDFSYFVLEELKMDYNEFTSKYTYDKANAYELFDGEFVAVGDKYGPITYTKDLFKGSILNDVFEWTIDPLEIGEDTEKTLYVKFTCADGYSTLYFELTASVAKAAAFDFGANKSNNDWYDDINGELMNTARLYVPKASSSNNVNNYVIDLKTLYSGNKPAVTLSSNSDPIYKGVDLEASYCFTFSMSQPYINGIRLFTNPTMDQLFSGSYNSPSLIAEINPEGIITFNNEGGDTVAKYLLNLWSFTSTNQNSMFYANVDVEITYGDCEIPAGMDSFHVRFVRPIDVYFQGQSFFRDSPSEDIRINIAKFISGIKNCDNQAVITPEIINGQYTGYYVANTVQGVNLYSFYKFKSLRINTGSAMRNNWNTSDASSWGLVSSVTPNASLTVENTGQGNVYYDSGEESFVVDISNFNYLRNCVIKYTNNSATDESFTLRIPIQIEYAWGYITSELNINIK